MSTIIVLENKNSQNNKQSTGKNNTFIHDSIQVMLEPSLQDQDIRTL